jgi:hypothetical protein
VRQHLPGGIDHEHVKVTVMPWPLLGIEGGESVVLPIFLEVLRGLYGHCLRIVGRRAISRLSAHDEHAGGHQNNEK